MHLNAFKNGLGINYPLIVHILRTYVELSTSYEYNILILDPQRRDLSVNALF